MSEADKEKTAITGPLGLFQSEKMPQGISGALATFPPGMGKTMGKTMGDVDLFGVLVYLDDLLALGFALEDYEARRVRDPGRLGINEVKLSLDECQVWRRTQLLSEKICTAELNAQKCRLETECCNFGTTTEELQSTFVKVEMGKRNSEPKLRSFTDELIHRDKTMTNLRKDQQKLKKSIQNRLEETGGVIASQMEMNTKRESELLRLWQELEESRKKLTSRLQEAEEAAEAAQAKCFRLEKIKQQLPIK
ncbi:myosin heavy chain, skeletal muscle-like [Mobula hypostoma]|uniref:myosin heavy chain, skeletal muscle-like n=1 Tax=Mobula hypostoma TaxID=723540 RepID=UPI002FC2ADB3